jgi:hypothetical protein
VSSVSGADTGAADTSAGALFQQVVGADEAQGTASSMSMTSHIGEGFLHNAIGSHFDGCACLCFSQVALGQGTAHGNARSRSRDRRRAESLNTAGRWCDSCPTCPDRTS